MSMRIRFQYVSGYTLGFSIERLADGWLYDFATTGATATTFTASPTTLVAAIPEDTGSYIGRYKATLTNTPVSRFSDGDYCVTIHNMTSNNLVVAELGVVMHSGDDATVIPSASGVDPWAQSLPGSYVLGTAGNIVGNNLDAKVSTRLPLSTYVAPPTDYQQRGQSVVLPTAAPSWYVTPSSPTVAQIVTGVWDEPRSNHVVVNTFGSSLDTSISSRFAASNYIAPSNPTD